MWFNIESFGAICDVRADSRTDSRSLAAMSRSRALRLSRFGAAPGQIVLVRHGGSPRFFADLFAIWECGAAAAVVNPSITVLELETLVSFISPCAILLDGERDGSVAGCPAIDLDRQTQEAAVAGASKLDDDALILFTSGTTGVPKGVVHSFRSLLARVSLNIKHVGANDLRRSLCVLPTHFGHGLIGNCLTPLLSGGDVLLGPGSDLKFAMSLGSTIDHYHVTFMSSVPSFWKLAQKGKSPSGDSLQRIHVGSAPLSIELWNNVTTWSRKRNVWNMYGITETANWIGGASIADRKAADGLVGQLWGGSAGVVADNGKISIQGEGELVVQTPSLMRGYLKRPELNAECLIRGWFRTGDIGRIDDDGFIWLIGRQKEEINRGGLKVHPEDIDALLERHPEIREACAFGISDSMSGESVGVAIVPMDGAVLDTQVLADWMLDKITAEKVPSRWYVISEIPRNERGKVNRTNVAEYCLNLRRKVTA